MRSPIAIALILAACSSEPVRVPPGGNAPMLLPLTTADVSSLFAEHLRRTSGAFLAAGAALPPSNLVERLAVPTEMTPDARASFDADRDAFAADATGGAALARVEPTRLTYRASAAAMCDALEGSCAETFTALALELVVTQPRQGTLAFVVRTSSSAEEIVKGELTATSGTVVLDLGQALGPISRAYATGGIGGDDADRPTRMSGRVELRWSASSDRELSASFRALSELVIEREANYRFVLPAGATGSARLDGAARALELGLAASAFEASMPFRHFEGFVSRVGCGIELPCPELSGTLAATADELALDARFEASADRVRFERVGFGAAGASLSLDGARLFALTGRGSAPGVFGAELRSSPMGVEISSVTDASVELVMSLASLRAQQIDVADWSASETLRFSAMGSPALRLQEMIGMDTFTRILSGTFSVSYGNGARSFTARAGECVSSMALAEPGHPFDELAAGPCQ